MERMKNGLARFMHEKLVRSHLFDAAGEGKEVVDCTGMLNEGNKFCGGFSVKYTGYSGI